MQRRRQIGQDARGSVAAAVLEEQAGGDKQKAATEADTECGPLFITQAQVIYIATEIPKSASAVPSTRMSNFTL